MMYRLIILNGPLKGQRITIEAEPATLGRDPSCTFCLPDEECAQRHAQVEQRGVELFIRDLGTMNRILVNKREVRDSRLKHGDVVDLGRTRFLVEAILQAEIGSPLSVSSRTRRLWAAVGVAALALLAALAWFEWGGGWRSSASRDDPDPPAATTGGVAAAVSSGGGISNDVVSAATAAVAAATADAPRLWAGPAEEPDTAAARQELEKIQTEIASLRYTVEGLAALTNRPPEVVRVVEPGPVVVVTNVPAVTREQTVARMFESYRKASADSKFGEAEKILGGLEALDPTNRAVSVERARLSETRGMFKKAIVEWRALETSASDPEERRAAGLERARLEQEERRRAEGERGRIRIASVEQVRMPPAEGVIESRSFTVDLQPEGGVEPFDPESVRAELRCFGLDPNTGAVLPMAGRLAAGAVTPEGPWRTGETRRLTLTWTLRADQAPAVRPAYHGFHLGILYRDRPQDETWRPRDLLPAPPPGELSGEAAPPSP